MIENDPDIMNLIFFSNEAHCHLSIKKTCVSGVSVSPMNTPIVNLPSRKGLCDVPYNEMASLGHSPLRLRMRIGWQ